MKTSFIIVTDFYFSEINGGAEANAEALMDRFVDCDINITKTKSAHITVEFLKANRDKIFIFSNFIFLKEHCKNYAISNLKYFVYEQDHKYIKSRNPIKYVNFIAPKEERINIEFYKGAIKVLFLTKLSMEVFQKNTDLDNLLNLKSSVWRKKELEFLKEICDNEKNNKVAIMNSDNPIKRKQDCIETCRKNSWDYDLVSDRNFKNFLKKLSKYEKLLFLTGHLETCARIVVEAKMLNLKVITNKKLIGAASEEWYSLSGKELIDEMEKISSNMPMKILETIND
jgi:hypothetical protein|tara:strand:- start:112 stop:963 length:852 start_codon:yes stop_codon:yes gene_type:complete